MGLFLEIHAQFLEAGPCILIESKHGQSNLLPSGVQLLWIADAFIWIFEFFNLLDELGLGLDMSEHFLANEHLIEDQASAPDITLLIVLFQFEHLWSSIERSAGTLGHLYLHIASEPEVCNLKFLILIEKDVIRFEIPMQLFYVIRHLLSLLM